MQAPDRRAGRAGADRQVVARVATHADGAGAGATVRRVADLLDPASATFETTVPVVVIGGGGCGLAAALAARGAGADVLVLERDARPRGTTAMSTGLIPAAGTRLQRERGIDDSPEAFARDIVAKARGQTDEAIALALARESAPTVEWLADAHGVPLSLVDGFLYPGHSVLRMHGTPNRTGGELMAALGTAAERAGVDVLTDALATELYAERDGTVRGVRVRRPDGTAEDVGCGTLVLACCGFAGNPAMVAEYIPEIAGATFHGHPGNKGDAIRWGRALGAAVRDVHAYQGHGGLAAGHGIPILWPLIMEGGFQVNLAGERFSDESCGYSEQAVSVVAQPGAVAWDVYDERLHRLMQGFDDYRDALEAKAVLRADDVAGLARATGLPEAALARTLAQVAACARGEAPDPFGRDFSRAPALAPPYYAVKVTGALFHTQGGLAVDAHARVLREDGTAFPNLYAGGGAARGISGPSSWGYMAGNGLLTATTFGRLAGAHAARAALRFGS
jgi:fumarate reductase flavoprotein subunit